MFYVQSEAADDQMNSNDNGLFYVKDADCELPIPQTDLQKLLALWITIGSNYYIKTDRSFQIIRFLPKGFLADATTGGVSLQFLDSLAAKLERHTFDLALSDLLERLRCSNPELALSGPQSTVFESDLEFFKAALVIVEKRLYTVYPAKLKFNTLNDYAIKLLLQAKTNINCDKHMPHGLFTQILPQPRSKANAQTSDGKSSKYYRMRKSDMNFQVTSDQEYVFWNIKIVDYLRLWTNTQWSLMIYQPNRNQLTLLDLGNYVNTTAINCFGSAVLFRHNSPKPSPNFRYTTLHSLYLTKLVNNGTSQSVVSTRWNPASFELQLFYSPRIIHAVIMILACCNSRFTSFGELYHIVNECGSGNFSSVYVAVDNITNERVAIKIIDKRRSLITNCYSELACLMGLRHPNVLQYRYAFATKDLLAIVTEYVDGIKLNSYLRKYCYTELEVREAMMQLLSALDYFHSLSIIHRDLKTENIMLRHNNAVSVCIIDFGLATSLSSSKMTMRCGSPGFVAPEVLNHKIAYDTKCDLFSLGVVMYAMLTGKEPFQRDTVQNTIKANANSVVQLNDPKLLKVSNACRSLLNWLLQKDKKKRCCAHLALQHPFITGDSVMEKQQTINSNSDQFINLLPSHLRRQMNQESNLDYKEKNLIVNHPSNPIDAQYRYQNFAQTA